jgi:gas vesicle protein
MGKAMVPVSFGLGVILGSCAAIYYGSDSGKMARDKFRNKFATKYDERLNELNEKILIAQQLADDLKKRSS